jgi:hypothetical protein
MRFLANQQTPESLDLTYNDEINNNVRYLGKSNQDLVSFRMMEKRAKRLILAKV